MAETREAPYAWSSIGGHLALDLCNTASWRLDPARRIDRLATPSDLVDWFATLTGSPSSDQLRQQLTDQPQAADQALLAVRQLREALIRVLDHQLGHPAAPGSPAIEDDVNQLATAWRAALVLAGTAPELPWRWTIAPTTAALLAPALALSVGELLHRPDPAGLRRCDGAGCGWLFLDTTRNHSRRWCDPLDCGNRARVRNYTERRRKGFSTAG